MQMEEILNFFKSHKIKMTKLNHSLDSSTQRFTQYQGYLHMMNENGFDIMLKKPINNNKYILEADPTIIEQEKQQFQDNKRELMVNHFLKNKQRRGIRIPSFMTKNNGSSV